MSVHFHSYSNLNNHDIGLLVFVIAPAVFLLCWLYNAKKLGKFQKKKHASPDGSLRTGAPRWLVILCGILLGILLGLAIRLL